MTHEHKMRLGVGEAILRLVYVELQYANGLFELPDNLRAERDSLVKALNQIELSLSFDCNNDGIPDTVEIFQQSAETSCCRLVPSSNGGTSASRGDARNIGSSRRRV